MTTCANCTDNAIYTYQITPTSGINYCQYHLPRFLYQQRDAGLLTLQVAPVVEPVVEEPAPKSKKKPAITEEPVVDPAPIVGTPVVEPAPEEPAIGA